MPSQKKVGLIFTVHPERKQEVLEEREKLKALLGEYTDKELDEAVRDLATVDDVRDILRYFEDYPGEALPPQLQERLDRFLEDRGKQGLSGEPLTTLLTDYSENFKKRSDKERLQNFAAFKECDDAWRNSSPDEAKSREGYRYFFRALVWEANDIAVPLEQIPDHEGSLSKIFPESSLQKLEEYQKRTATAQF